MKRLLETQAIVLRSSQRSKRKNCIPLLCSTSEESRSTPFEWQVFCYHLTKDCIVKSPKCTVPVACQASLSIYLEPSSEIRVRWEASYNASRIFLLFVVATTSIDSIKAPHTHHHSQTLRQLNSPCLLSQANKRRVRLVVT